jgi:hypothetical protein
MEDIWQHDWEACRQFAKSQGMTDIPDYEIPKQSQILNLIANLSAKSYAHLRAILSFFKLG